MEKATTKPKKSCVVEEQNRFQEKCINSYFIGRREEIELTSKQVNSVLTELNGTNPESNNQFVGFSMQPSIICSFAHLKRLVHDLKSIRTLKPLNRAGGSM